MLGISLISVLSVMFLLKRRSERSVSHCSRPLRGLRGRECLRNRINVRKGILRINNSSGENLSFVSERNVSSQRASGLKRTKALLKEISWVVLIGPKTYYNNVV